MVYAPLKSVAGSGGPVAGNESLEVTSPMEGVMMPGSPELQGSCRGD